MAKEILSRRLFLRKVAGPALAVISAGKVADARSKQNSALDELGYICQNTTQCGPLAISPYLMRRAVRERAGKVVKSEQLGSSYRHTLSSKHLGFEFRCYTNSKKLV
jgi:hypothetical protein